MSELEETTQGLTETRSLTDVLRSCLDCAVISTGPDQDIISFNPAAGELTGLQTAHVLHHPASRLPAQLRELIAETTSTGNPIQGRQLCIHHPKRGPITLHASVTPFESQDGSYRGITLTLNELPPKLECQTRQLDRLASIGTLSASMAHEIKNALVPVRTFVDLLVEDNKDNELGTLVGREISRVDSILSQMLRFAGPAKPTFVPVGIHEILEIAINLTRRKIQDQNATLSTTFNAPCDTINGDSYQLEAAFMNLLFNALEATEANGNLDITTDLLPAEPRFHPDAPPSRPLLRITFSDDGPGISPENINRLFDPFFTTKSAGTGLGLSITHRIIKEHKGSIHVESRPGRGATFTLLFPSLINQ